VIQEVTLTTVEIRNGESGQSLVRRFRRAVSRSGVLRDVRKKRWFVSKSEQRRIERKKSIRRIRRRSHKNNGR
jgi:small subunit ribosomal protein S21